MLDTTAQSVNSLLRRARAAFESRLPAAERERAPLPDSKRERDTVGRFADAIQTGDIDGVVALLTDEAWLTMPPEPYEYQGPARIGSFLTRPHDHARRAATGTDPRQHPTSIRRLLPNPPDRDRPTVRNARPDPRGPADLRDHLVWRQQRLPALRAAADTPIGKHSPGRDAGAGRGRECHRKVLPAHKAVALGSLGCKLRQVEEGSRSAVSTASELLRR